MREPAKTFEDLLVWQKAHQFVLAIYKITAVFPKSEIYGLASRFRRAAVSIAANIAEGFRKRSDTDKLRFIISHRDRLRNVVIIWSLLKISVTQIHPNTKKCCRKSVNFWKPILVVF